MMFMRFCVSDFLIILSVFLLLTSALCTENGNPSSEDKQDKSKENVDEESDESNKQGDKGEDDEFRQPPPYEDLYCGHMNCYDLLGVTRLIV